MHQTIAGSDELNCVMLASHVKALVMYLEDPCSQQLLSAHTVQRIGSSRMTIAWKLSYEYN